MKHNSFSQDLALLALRVSAGGSMLAAHGVRKAERLFAGGEIRFADPIGLGTELSLYLVVAAEVLCAALVAIGLLSRLATIPLLIMLLVIIFAVHFHDPFSEKELPIFYGMAFLVILTFGPGRFSLDHWFQSRRI